MQFLLAQGHPSDNYHLFSCLCNIYNYYITESPLPCYDSGVDIGKMKSIICGVLDKRHADLCLLLTSCLKPLADKLFSVALISNTVHSSPSYNSIMNEVKGTMSFMRDPGEVVSHCTKFLKAISEQGFPQKHAATSLAEELSVAINEDLKTKIDFQF